MPPILSPRGFFLLAALLSCVLAAIVEAQASSGRRGRKLPDLATIGLLAHGLGLGLFSQRGEMSPVVTIYLANLLIVSALSFLYLGIERLQGDMESWLVAAVPPGAIAILFPIMGFGESTLVERVAVFSIVSFISYSMIVFAALRALRTGCRSGPLIIAFSVTFVLALQIARAVVMIDQARGDLFANAWPQIAYSALTGVALVCVVWGYMILVSHTFGRPGNDVDARAG